MNVSLEPIISQGDTKAARALGFTTRKPWDPLTASHMNILRQKLGHSNMPFILCVPSRPSLPKNPPQLRRMRFWHTQPAFKIVCSKIEIFVTNGKCFPNAEIIAKNQNFWIKILNSELSLDHLEKFKIFQQFQQMIYLFMIMLTKWWKLPEIMC